MNIVSLRRSLLPGFCASTAYLAAMAIDLRVFPSGYDDLVLWGGFLSRRPRRQHVLGALVHFGLGASLAALYSATPLLAGQSGWLRGLLFAEAEHLLTFPSVAVGTRIHPAVRSGRLPPLPRWRYFWVETARHAAYGVVLGALMPRDSTSSCDAPRSLEESSR